MGILSGMGLQEKTELPPDAINFDYVDNALMEAGPAEKLTSYDLLTNGDWSSEANE
jgi:hypothetical protein